MAKRGQGGRSISLAKDYFDARTEAFRLAGMLQDRVAEFLGAISQSQVGFSESDESVTVCPAPNSLRATEEAQRKIYDLGFKRIWLRHGNGTQTYYYDGGDPRGHLRTEK